MLQIQGFRQDLRKLRMKHIRTKPYTPRTNGKAEAARMNVHVLQGHLVLTFAAMAVERPYEGHARNALPEAAASSKGMRGISSGLSARSSRWSSASVKPVSARSAWAKADPSAAVQSDVACEHWVWQRPE
jgi:hypothetical protein